MQYQVIPVRQELIPPMYATDVTIGKPYDVVSAKTTEGGYFIGGNVTLNSGATYYIEPELHANGFVVKRVYVEDADETDPVLRAWGDYTDVSVFDRKDRPLFDWVLTWLLNTTADSDTFKSRFRLLSMQPMRSQIAEGKVSIYQSLKDMHNDRQIAMKPGRAFSFMFPEFEHKQIIMMTDEYLKEFADRDLTLHQAKDAESFKRAYSHEQSHNENIDTTWFRKHLAHSCMRYEFDHLPMHPAEAYAPGDFEVVYATDAHGRIAARTNVYLKHPDKQLQASPIYGVSEQAIDFVYDHLILRNVEVRDPDFTGAKLRRVEHDGGGFIAPYLDLVPQALDDTGTHLVVAHGGEINATDYGGVLNGHHTNCTSCGDGLDEDEYYYSETTDQHYCECCYYNVHFYCEYAGEDVHEDDAVVVYRVSRNGRQTNFRVSRDYIQSCDTFLHCDDDDEYWDADDVTYIECEDIWVSPNGIDDYFLSDWDGDWYPRTVMCTLEDGDDVAKSELDNHEGTWELQEDSTWKNVQGELDV